MKLVIICGLLGSGKTTFLLRLARSTKKIFPNIVIIENEAGEVGIDGYYLDYEGLQVQELYSGCVCCTLSADLVSTLGKVRNLYRPDLVMVEVSGIARPGNVVETLQRYAKGISGIKVISIIDASRYKVFHEMLLPLLTANVKAADVAVVNKTDKVDPSVVEGIIADLQVLKKGISVKTVSALFDGEDVVLWEDYLER